jgi:hypothetical protein
MPIGIDCREEYNKAWNNVREAKGSAAFRVYPNVA